MENSDFMEYFTINKNKKIKYGLFATVIKIKM